MTEGRYPNAFKEDPFLTDPKNDEVLYAGRNYTIKWALEGTAKKFRKIDHIRLIEYTADGKGPEVYDPQFATTSIAGGFKNTGKYEWTPSKRLDPGKDYQISLTFPDGYDGLVTYPADQRKFKLWNGFYQAELPELVENWHGTRIETIGSEPSDSSSESSLPVQPTRGSSQSGSENNTTQSFTETNGSPSSTTPKTKTPVATIAGGVVGGVCLMIVLIGFLLWRRRSQHRIDQERFEKPELEATEVTDARKVSEVLPFDGTVVSELEGAGLSEMEGTGISEMDSPVLCEADGTHPLDTVVLGSTST
ncbi:hypothetical protein BJ508DRAFT_306917 [Ascobolus immersus RN42]|uniref:Yeast cell wall synthesis Kre9/Knh1-like N-terminal domain-containing protein n=1 Tax=Ascobolus immersus RN42 TaxID=1160509 RepID=A0A3N4I9Y9_ASCIM|nr:hypothetical protein BJ508DRAFT_306917 [Ascobolus immersus RN42]